MAFPVWAALALLFVEYASLSAAFDSAPHCAWTGALVVHADAPRVGRGVARFAGCGGALWLALRVFGSVPIVPVAEELAFRGYLLGRLQAREFLAVPFERWIPWAVLVSSAAFGAIHAGWLGGTLAGLMFAIVQIRGRTSHDDGAAHLAARAIEQ
jgi:membrane protease YdiL (CAAX protease family)